MYDLEIERVAEEVGKRKAKRVLLQLPDGLRPEALKLLKALRDRSPAEYFLHGDSCYGGCDVAIRQGQAIMADLIVHYGHSRMIPDSGIPVFYVEAKVDFDADRLVESAIPQISGWKRIGLATTVQHAHKLSKVAEALRERGYTAVLGRGGRKTPYDGQVLGCDYSSMIAISSLVDGFLFVGGGRFHPLGLAYATGKPVVAADPYNLTAFRIEEAELKKLAMRRMAAISAVKNSKSIGIVVSVKPGQFELKAAEELKIKLEHLEKNAVIICLDEVRADALLNFSELDAFITTACPRLALDGVGDLPKPLINLDEALIMLDEGPWK